MASGRLSAAEQETISSSSWFAALSPVLRQELLRHMLPRRLSRGEPVFARGEPVREWLACAGGTVRVASTAANGKQLTLAFVGPGRWFGDVPLAGHAVRSHDAHAHGPATVAALSRTALKDILGRHPELYEALLRLQSLRMRQVFGLAEDLASLGLQARLARQLLYLMRTHGVACRGGEVRIALRLQQHLLAALLGCSRQRVNECLMDLVQARVIRKEAGALVVRDRQALQAYAVAP